VKKTYENYENVPDHELVAVVAVAWAGLLKSPQSETSPNQFSIGNLTPQ
jgi:hypothetical protein